MIRYGGVFLDETRCEFGAPITAPNKAEAWRIAKEDYPESRCVQLESPEETAERERATYEAVVREMDEESGYYDEPDDFDEDDFEVPDDAYDLKEDYNEEE